MDYKKFLADIETFGFTVLMLDGTDYLPSFAYTVGLWKNFEHPEIISFGLSVQNLQTLLNRAGELVKAGNVMEAGRTYDDFFNKGQSEFIKVDERSIGDYFGYAMELYDYEKFPALQLVWTDRNNKFPWEPNFEEELLYRQPLLDRNADFKFREPRNLGVFTTKQHFDRNMPILRVVHDGDGDWQFLTGDETPEDAMLVSLDCMVDSDNTLNEVFDLDYGEEAVRELVGGDWERNFMEEE